MRLLTIAFSLIALVLLFIVANLRWGFVRVSLPGLESGLIVASLALFVGLAFSALAAVLAFLQLRVANVPSARCFWCGVSLCFLGDPRTTAAPNPV